MHSNFLPSCVRLATAFLFTLPLLPAQTLKLLGVDFAGTAYEVDLATGQSRNLGPTGATGCNAMTTDLPGKTWYATARSGSLHQLVTIDPIDAHATVVAANLGVDVRGLCHGSGGELFGIANGPDNQDSLVRIVPSSGQVIPVGPTGMNGIQAVARKRGTLVAWDIALGIVDIDFRTGVATDRHPALGAGTVDIQFLTFVGDRLYGGSTQLYEIVNGVPIAVGAAVLPGLRGADQRLGRVGRFGTTCPAVEFVPGLPPALSAATSAMPGSGVTFLATHNAPNATGMLVTGFTLVPVPATLGSCPIAVSQDTVVPVTLNQSGALKIPFVLPNLLGVDVFAQLVTLAPVQNGTVVTHGVRIEVPQ